jgi:CBS domain containing-hemolysin-like protein
MRSLSLSALLLLPVARFDQDSESYAQFEDAFVSTKKQENANNSTTTLAQSAATLARGALGAVAMARFLEAWVARDDAQ